MHTVRMMTMLLLKRDIEQQVICTAHGTLWPLPRLLGTLSAAQAVTTMLLQVSEIVRSGGTTCSKPERISYESIDNFAAASMACMLEHRL